MTDVYDHVRKQKQDKFIYSIRRSLKTLKLSFLILELKYEFEVNVFAKMNHIDKFKQI